jgi:glycine/D-amino acid oxidase-like deaminating enzyme
MFSKADLLSPRSGMNTAKEAAEKKIASLKDIVFDVVIVGGGITGATAAYHFAALGQAGPKSVLLVDSGELGAGSHDRVAARIPPNAIQGLGDETKYHPGNSGGVVFSLPHFTRGPTRLKFMVRVYPTTTPHFIEHNGREGARRYLALAAIGLELQKSLAKKLFPGEAIKEVMDECGSVMLAEADTAKDLEGEFELLRSLGCDDIELWDGDRIAQYHGAPSKFVQGIYFPKEARIDALAYVRALLAVAAKSSTLTIVEYSPAVTAVKDVDKGAVVNFDGGVAIRCNKAVLATNGLFLNPHLAGILRPCWSYFVALPHPRDPLKDGNGPSAPALLGGNCSHNFFTYGFTHDWCVTDGVYRISGADHFSALKAPRAGRRCQELADWTYEKYPHMRELIPNVKDLSGRYVYGVYGETPDYLPLLGKVQPSSNVIYGVGCNAWGQTSMTFVGSVIPAMCGYGPALTKEVSELADVMAIARFTTMGYYLHGKL